MVQGLGQALRVVQGRQDLPSRRVVQALPEIVGQPKNLIYFSEKLLKENIYFYSMV